MRMRNEPRFSCQLFHRRWPPKKPPAKAASTSTPSARSPARIAVVPGAATRLTARAVAVLPNRRRDGRPTRARRKRAKACPEAWPGAVLARCSHIPTRSRSGRLVGPFAAFCYAGSKRTRYSAPELVRADDQICPVTVRARVPSSPSAEPPAAANAALRSIVPLPFIRKNRSG
jgi:hypothetical protein